MSQSRECLLIALEGADRVGKATQATLLKEALTTLGVRTTVAEVPYKDEVTHPEIYRFLRDGGAHRFPQAFQTLHAINRRLFQTEALPSLMLEFDVIILDRWNLSTRVYGSVGGCDEELTEIVLRGVVEPTRTLVLDALPWPKPDLDVLEVDTDFQQRVREKYRGWCLRDPSRFVLIDAARNLDAVHQDILAAVRPLLDFG
jgi:dTMP kinase